MKFREFVDKITKSKVVRGIAIVIAVILTPVFIVRKLKKRKDK